MPKLRNYSLFKQESNTEEYVLANLTRWDRSLLAQLRFGTLPLNIECGRARNLPVQNRLCKLCSLDEIEDEFHFIFVCPLYAGMRNLLLDGIKMENSDFDDLTPENKLSVFFNSDVKLIIKFLSTAWSCRTKHLYK